MSHEVDGDVAVVRLHGEFTLEECAKLVSDAILQVKASGGRALLVDFSAIENPPPGVGARHWVMTEWAKAGRGAIRFGMLIRPEFVDPDHFGTSVARSRGLDAKGFLDETKAMEWLRRQRD